MKFPWDFSWIQPWSNDKTYNNFTNDYQKMCSVEHIQKLWRSFWHAGMPRRYGIPTMIYWRNTCTRNHTISCKSKLLYPNAPPGQRTPGVLLRFRIWRPSASPDGGLVAHEGRLHTKPRFSTEQKNVFFRKFQTDPARPVHSCISSHEIRKKALSLKVVLLLGWKMIRIRL